MEGKISHSGLLARSPEGHAARGMQIKGNEDLWVDIQANTFRNWVNEHLPQDLRVADLSKDLCTGVRLCLLVEALRKKPLKPSWNKRPANQHHYLENVTCALSAIEQDGIKLVNIGNTDIVNGNLKLILGLIWSLIVHYQIGRSKFPPRKLMLSWLQAVLPECKVSNLTTDWNSGVLLSALVDYCRPGLFPHWRQLDRSNEIENCRRAMNIAQKDLGIPAVLEPEYLASPWLDELSGMTYLSYFMKPGSPGFYATLRWVNSRLERSINNFTTDWNDGRVISEVIRSLGGSAAAPEKLRSDYAYWEQNQIQAIEAGRRLGVQPVLSAKDMADRNVEHLGVMAYAAHFQWVPERPPLHDLINVTLNSTSGRVGEPTYYQVTLLDSSLSYSKLSTEIRGPDNKIYLGSKLQQGKGNFVPSKVGMHEIIVKYEGEEVQAGHYFRVLPPLVEVAPPGMAPCALGSLVQVLVNATGAPRREDILVTAYSPSGRPLDCPLTVIDGTNSATFKPDEPGEWRIEITYQGKQIQGGPFTCSVFDPNGVQVSGIEGALPLIPHAIEVDCRGVGVPGEVVADIVHDKKSVHCHVEKIDNFHYRIHFTPKDAGKHRVYVYFNGYDVKGSPFMMRVGTQKRSKISSSPTSPYRASPTNRFNSPSPNLSTPTKNSSYTSYRQNASPLLDETHKFAQDYHMKSVSEKRMPSSSPIYQDRTHSPSYNQRTHSPVYRTASPNFHPPSPNYRPNSPPVQGRDSPDFITSRKLNEKRYDFTNKMSSMRLEDSRSPSYLERSSPDVGFTSTSRYDKRVSENRVFTNSSNGVDTTPIIKVSSLNDQSSARRDSWDAIAKTKNILSDRSLESLANLTESQLDTDIRRRKAEEHSKFVLKEQSYQTNYNENYSSSKKYSDSFGRNSPVYSRVRKDGGASSVKVQPVPDGVLGQPVEFEIDGSGAGSGDLEILVEGGRVTSSVKSLGGQRFRAAFTPHQALPHRVDIRFNGETVPGSPWHVNIMSNNSALSVLGEATRLVPANSPAVFEIITPSSTPPSDLRVHVVAPSKRVVSARVIPGNRLGVHSVEFVPTEIGTHLIDVSVDGEKLPSGPLMAKVYDAGLIQVADVGGGVVGQPVQFRVDASQAGEGQLEISINEGEVPNHVQVVGGGRCLVSFTPDQAKPHLIDIKFNGETVRGCPFVCAVSDTSRVTLSLSHLELIPVNQPSSFHMGVAGGGAAELAVAVRGPVGELPVKVTGDIHSGFTAEFTPTQVGAHQISVDYNGRPVQGTPFIAKSFDSNKVTVGTVARGTVGRPVTFSVDASEAGEGNLEITISARGLNIPTQVHPQGNARFAVSFVPAEACDHVVNVAFNKRPVVGCPLIVNVGGSGTGPSVTLPGPGPVHRPSTLLINHPGRLEDIEVNVEGPGGQAVPTQVQPLGNGQFRAEFVPRVVGEHRVNVSVSGVPTVGSPYAAKVYDVQAIKIKEAASGIVGKPVTFLVETSQAGPGNLEVTVNGGLVPTSAQAQGPHTYAISFTPREATVHSVDLRFNGQDVPGSPFKCAVSPAARILSLDTLDKVSVGKPCTFVVESPNPPTVEILGPARRALVTKVRPQENTVGKFEVTFTPIDVGDHSVEVRLQSGHIDGSPFLIKAYDANRVTVTDITDGIVGKPVSFSINASQAGAGNLEIIVAVGGRNVPNFVQSEGNARFKVNFKPTEAATHTLSVRFNGQPVPGSPFNCKVSPGNTQPRVPVSGSGIELAAVGHPAEIKIEGVTGGEPQVLATAPNGKTIPTKLIVNGDTYIARFIPESVGRHSIAILINDQHVIGSPFSCNVYDVNKVIVTGLPERKGDLNTSINELSLKDAPKPAEVGKPVTFSVDAAQAGEGTLELVVSTQHTTIKAEVVACARGLYDVTFVPLTAEDHYVNITFNDMTVVGSPFHCSVIESTQYFQIGATAYIDLPSDNHKIEISDPNNHHVKYVVNNYKGEFSLTQTGTYRVNILRDNEVVATRTFHVFDTTKIDIINAPEAICHRPSAIGINMNRVGPGKLTAAVKVGNRDVSHSVRQSPTNANMWEVIFHPVQAAPHRITLFYNGVPKFGVLEIPVKGPGSEPWAGGLGLYQAKVGKVNSFQIETQGRSAREFDVVVSGPTGSAVPVRCYQTKTGKLQAEFTSREIGAHKVEVLHQGKHLVGSPFVCQAFDPDNVKITDVPTSQGNVGDKVYFNISTKSSGSAELDVQVTNPIHQTLAVQKVQSDENTTQVMFLPALAGLYQVAITYGGIPVKGSPLALGVGPVGPTPPPRAVGKGLEFGRVGERSSFTVSSVVQPRVSVEAVEGNIDVQVQSHKPGEYQVSYVPKWVGTYDVIISIGPNDLPGSPFRPSVVDPAAVRLIGGWNQYLDDTGRIKLPAKLAFDTSNAGPGNLECKISGRKVNQEKSNTRIRFELSGEGLSPGEHEFDIRFANYPLPEAPSSIICLGDQVVLTGRGLAHAQCGDAATFTIDGSKASIGNPEVTLHAADNNIPVPVMISLAGDKIWKAAYTVSIPGNYLLSVLWAGRPVKGCPLVVEAKGGADASKVLCSGEGLRQGVVGREIRSWIDTRRAGPGELTAHCAGPRKVAYCELYDHGDATFTLNVKPQEPGRHALTIKYAGQHVPGSPFTLRVAGAPDASKVRVYGPGIEHGVLATFQSRFICDTRGAGAGQLTVRVRGPKGAFRVEMQRESQKDRTILCKYDPTEPGDYRVEVKWAGELVPGSPFHVMIFDTQEELRRYINTL
ncbi:filamin-A isoform X1 [Diabrotica virgifera virgifera]|uniref:Calponin-homology (CH) domain-containing protein n=2 Tax=Diabrotica virgifera virgifera TaxID=50390 RepID=A0ABM5KX14_DIAVI|nr:filamin-A isoform X1 [Diabrotica virgifera virgifera]